MTTTTLSMPRASLQKSLKERVFQALVFETIAVTLCASAGVLLGYSLVQVGSLTVAISMIAVGWNMFFNLLFDRAQAKLGFERTWKARAAHAALFELGLIVTVVPLAAWWLDISLWRAFVLDIGLVLFFLPYTFFFNLTYDRLRERLMSRKIVLAACAEEVGSASR